MRKNSKDEAQYAQFVRNHMPTAPIRTGLDGGMNRVFLAQVGGNIPPARKTATVAAAAAARWPSTTAALSRRRQRLVRRPVRTPAAAEPAQASATDAQNVDRSQANGGTGFFNSLFASKAQEPAAVPVTTATVEPPKPKSVPRYETAAVAPKPKAAEPRSVEPRKTEPPETTATAAPKAKPAPQQQEANAASPPAANASLINGAQAAVPSGNFDSRWGGLQ